MQLVAAMMGAQSAYDPSCCPSIWGVPGPGEVEPGLGRGPVAEAVSSPQDLLAFG